jgi:hypothetical protein
MGSRKLELTKDDLLFLDTLVDCHFDHVSEIKLKGKLKELGMGESLYNTTRRKLLFNRFIGSVYGNLTLEKKDFRPLKAEGDKDPS